MSPVSYELGLYIPEDGILHSHRSENLNSYKLDDVNTGFDAVSSRLSQKIFWIFLSRILSSRAHNTL
jgi:hypothetical protein